MKTLAFEPDAYAVHGRRVRAGRFVERSLLPVSAACLVANGVREALAGAIACDVEVRLLAPVVPSSSAWRAIADRSTIVVVHGASGDAALVLHEIDAAKLAAAVFGETVVSARELSHIERRVVERLVTVLAGALSPVCGVTAAAAGPGDGALLAGFAVYFEVLVEQPVSARIGIALAADAAPARGPSLQIEDLLPCELELRVRSEAPPISIAELAALELGSVVPMTGTTAFAGSLLLAGREIARGECGVLGPRFAFALGPSLEGSTRTAS